MGKGIMDYKDCYKDRTAVITGAGSGMGLLASQELAKAGANVVMCDINAEAVEGFAKEIREAGGKATASATLRQGAYVEPAPSGAKGGKAASAPFKWLELPSTDAADGMDFLWHMIDVGGRTIRNYSCYWNY